MQTHPAVATYRADIDGLRAVAVVSVFLYHLGVPGFAGGFVGVDVFFVISGFLITRLLVAEYDRVGSIDIRAFYVRRIRRIIPALAATLVLTTVAAVFFLAPTLLTAYAQSLVATLFSVSNLFFASQSGYFDGDAALKPLLHTWSLGVEEQFYLLWPLCIAVMCRVGSRRALWVGTIAVAATAAAAYWVTVDPTNTFYQMPFRVGEFAVGALLTCLPPRVVLPRWLATILGLCGYIAIGSAIFFYSDATLFPGLAALLPCGGAALCIWALPQATVVPRLLDNRLVVRIGVLSYVLYLVHWPVIVFAPYVRGFRPATGWDQLALVVVALGIAVVIHTLVETPLRSPQVPWPRFVSGIGALAGTLGVAALALWGTDGWQSRSWINHASLSPAAIAAGQNARFQINALMCARRTLDCSPPTDGKPRIIIEQPPADELSVLVIGDSHAIDALNALYPVLPEYQFYLSQLGACPPRPDIAQVLGKRFANLQQCLQLTEKRYDPAYLRQFDVIALNVLFVRYSPKELTSYLDFLQQNGIHKVIVFGNFVTLTRDMSEIISLYGVSPAAIESFRSAQPNFDTELQPQVEAHGFFYISKYAVLCPAARCTWVSADGTPFTYDKSHLSFPFASRLALPYRTALRTYVGADH